MKYKQTADNDFKILICICIPGIDELGSPGDAKILSVVSTLTSAALPRLYRIISGGIKDVSPSVSKVSTLPEINRIQ